MKNIFIYIAGICGALSLNSCDNDIDIWNSSTLDYSGTYFYQVYDKDDAIVHDYDNEFKLEFYNTSANIDNEIFIDDHDKLFEMRSKFFLNGDFKNFSSKETDFDKLENNEKAVILPGKKLPAEETVRVKPNDINDAITLPRSSVRIAIVEGKFIEKGATTKGGNIADSLYMKILVYDGTVSFKSALVPVEFRSNPDKEEFEWILNKVTTNANNAYVVKGHRKTGFEEDKY